MELAVVSASVSSSWHSVSSSVSGVLGKAPLPRLLKIVTAATAVAVGEHDVGNIAWGGGVGSAAVVKVDTIPPGAAVTSGATAFGASRGDASVCSVLIADGDTGGSSGVSAFSVGSSATAVASGRPNAGVVTGKVVAVSRGVPVRRLE